MQVRVCTEANASEEVEVDNYSEASGPRLRGLLFSANNHQTKRNTGKRHRCLAHSAAL